MIVGDELVLLYAVWQNCGNYNSGGASNAVLYMSDIADLMKELSEEFGGTLYQPVQTDFSRYCPLVN